MNDSKSGIGRKIESILKQTDRPLKHSELFAKIREGIDPAQAVRVYMQRSGEYHLSKNGSIPVSITEQIEIGRERMFYAAIRNKVASGKLVSVQVGNEKAYTLPDAVSDWTDVRLNRTGGTPLQFYGKPIAAVCGDPEEKRWHDIRLWETRSNKYVLCISYHSTWPGEMLRLCNYVEVMRDLNDLPNALREYNPIQYVRGYPQGDKFTDKQQRLLQSVTDQYLKRVTEILSALPQIVEQVD